MKSAQTLRVLDAIMEQAQVYASAWSLVGSRFDNGDELANAQAEKAELRALIERAMLEPIVLGVDMASGADISTVVLVGGQCAPTSEMVAAGIQAAQGCDPVLSTLYPSEVAAIYRAMRQIEPTSGKDTQ